MRPLIASAEHGRFKQTDADVGSFDAGYGSAYFARQIGQKFAREVFFLAEEYSAQRAYEMGAVNRVVPHADLEREAIAMARTILTKSPTAIRMLKFAFNAVDDGMVGQQVFAGEATRLAYGTDEAVEGRDSFLEKRDPDWSPYPWHTDACCGGSQSGRAAPRVEMHEVKLEPVIGDDPRDILRGLRGALHGAGPALGLGMVERPSRPRCAPAPAVVVTTSGSTGVPKSVILSRDALTASALATADRIGDGAWLLALPGELRRGHAGARALDRRRPRAGVLTGAFTPQAFAAAALMMVSTDRGERVPTYTSLVPAQLTKLLDAADARPDGARGAALVRDDPRRRSGARRPRPSSGRRMPACASSAPTASTETSGGCVYDGQPLRGVSVRIVDGEVQVAGPTLADGYLGDSEATDAAFPRDADGTRWYRTGDAGIIEDELLRVRGRIDNVIVSGGINVSLDRVERIVRGDPRPRVGRRRRRPRRALGRGIRRRRRRAARRCAAASPCSSRRRAPPSPHEIGAARAPDAARAGRRPRDAAERQARPRGDPRGGRRAALSRAGAQAGRRAARCRRRRSGCPRCLRGRPSPRRRGSRPSPPPARRAPRSRAISAAWSSA